MVEYGQQYSSQFAVIYSTCQKLFVKNQTEGPGAGHAHLPTLPISPIFSEFNPAQKSHAAHFAHIAQIAQFLNS
jgi:hypothetical protein